MNLSLEKYLKATTCVLYFQMTPRKYTIYTYKLKGLQRIRSFPTHYSLTHSLICPSTDKAIIRCQVSMKNQRAIKEILNPRSYFLRRIHTVPGSTTPTRRECNFLSLAARFFFCPRNSSPGSTEWETCGLETGHRECNREVGYC